MMQIALCGLLCPAETKCTTTLVSSALDRGRYFSIPYVATFLDPGSCLSPGNMLGGTLSEITDQELILRLRPLTKDCLKFQDYRVSVEKPLRFFCNATIVTIATLLSTTTSPHLLCSASSFSCFAGGYFGLLEWVNLCATLPLWK